MKLVIFICRYVEPFRSYVLPIDGASSKIEVFPSLKGRGGHFGGHLGIYLYPLLFHHENDFNGFLGTQNLSKDTKFITPRQMQMELYWV